MDVKKKLTELLADYFHIGDSYHYTLGRDKEAFGLGTMGLDDFEEYDEDTVAEIVEYLIAAGVSIQEPGRWIGEGDGYADGEIVYDVWYCSECNYCIDDGTDDPDNLPNHCPHCGARMEV